MFVLVAGKGTLYTSTLFIFYSIPIILYDFIWVLVNWKYFVP